MATMAVLASCPLFRAGLASLLQTMGFNPVKQAADVKELQQQLDEGISPEMLLIDLSHGGDKAVSADDIRTWAPVTRSCFWHQSSISACCRTILPRAHADICSRRSRPMRSRSR